MPDSTALLGFSCPRCGVEVSERFYGPCSECRTGLSAMGGDAVSVAAAPERYVPKMNVVPNQVATKD